MDVAATIVDRRDGADGGAMVVVFGRRNARTDYLRRI